MGERLDWQALIAQAEHDCGLSDWGGRAFEAPFACLVQSLEDEAELSELGLERAREWLAARLAMRLRIVADRTRDPGIAREAIDRPVFITGMPRSGTTFLHALLSRNLPAIAPAWWQMLTPSPPPNVAGTDRAAGIATAQAFMERQGWLEPEFFRIHEYDPELPEEDIVAFEYAFESSMFVAHFDAKSYNAMLAGSEFAEAYRWHRIVLQALQRGTGGRRWVLKAPTHARTFEALFREYPDATIVQSHRDPAKVIGSYLSLVSTVRKPYTDRVERVGRAHGLAYAAAYARALEDNIARRQASGRDSSFVDVQYLDLERRPLEVVREVCGRVGLPFGEAEDQAVAAWIAEHRQGKFGKHRYSLAQFGIEPDEIRALFGRYLDHYRIELEDVSGG